MKYPIAEHQAVPEFAVWAWAVVALDLAGLSDKPERVNITLPARVLHRYRRQGQSRRRVEKRLSRPSGAAMMPVERKPIKKTGERS